ncbi:MAG: 50S ribosomal protein L15 [Candidatus Latescibacterota bacterium]
MRIGRLSPARGAKKSRKRLGCGPGSGHGKTACRGHKGQGARSGAKTHPWFEGGQMPLQRRVPKRGFTNIFRVQRQVVNIRDLDRFEANAEVNAEALLDKGIIKNLKRPVKLLGEGELNKPLKVIVHACSKKAKEIVEKAGGEVQIVQ